jgi:putative IMPACT (imprinted ancient) family translation regulator
MDETLEQAGERLYPNRESFLHRFQNIERKAFTAGTEWQQEQDKNKYSEEEVYDILEQAMKDNSIEGLTYHYNGDFRNLKEWFEQFKKK